MFGRRLTGRFAKMCHGYGGSRKAETLKPRVSWNSERRKRDFQCVQYQGTRTLPTRSNAGCACASDLPHLYVPLSVHALSESFPKITDSVPRTCCAKTCHGYGVRKKQRPSSLQCLGTLSDPRKTFQMCAAPRNAHASNAFGRRCACARRTGEILYSERFALRANKFLYHFFR